MKKTISLILATSFFFTSISAQINLQDTARAENATVRSADSGFAEEAFRRGVQSYYRGSYNESIREFEEALSYLPGENLILDWLGKAYYSAGIEGAALQQWQFASESGYGGILLQNKIEIVSDRRLTQSEYPFSQKYTEAGAFPNIQNNILLYSQPFSSLPNPDGTVWVVAYGTNEILLYDVNGLILRRVRGPLNGFDRPTDILRLPDGKLLVCESAGDRLAVLDSNGTFLQYYGEKGRGEGQFIGPQYMALDSYGNIYVTDFGNARVVVFDSDGNPLAHFGTKDSSFAGLKSPMGIAIADDRVFVADSVTGAIYEFDRSGNFLGNLSNEKTFARPECLRVWGDSLILTDTNRIVTINLETGTIYENAKTGNAASLITSAVPDANGNLIVTDFKANDIYVMSKMTELVGGFFVQIEKVISDKFPNVTLEVKVENRRRQPIVGLSQTNFLVTENKRPVSNMTLSGAANRNDRADITLLIDRSYSMKTHEEEVTNAVREIASALDGRGNIQIISVGANPVLEFTGSNENLRDFSVKALKAPYSEISALDRGIRLSANNLISGEKKRGIIYLTDGSVTQNAFETYNLSDLTAFLNNNCISFSTVRLEYSSLSEEVSFITRSTTGSDYYVYRPEGLSGIIEEILSLPSGLYQITYTSVLSTEYGRKYLPVEVETYLLNHSGKDESGYFAPLE